MCVTMRRIVLCLCLLWPIAAVEPLYLALLTGDGSLVYQSQTSDIRSRIAVGQHPREMAFSPDRRYLYTTSEDAVAVIDVRSRRRIGDIPLGEHRRPFGVTVDPGTGMVAVTTQAPARLLLIDPARRTVVKRLDIKGHAPALLTFGRGGKQVYVSNAQEGAVAAIDIGSGDSKSIPTGERPVAAVLSADGRELYVLNAGSNNIAVIDTAKQQVIANILTGKGPERGVLTRDGKTLVYTLRHERKIAFADPAIRRQTDYLLVPADPVFCALSNTGEDLLVSTASGVIYRISLVTKRIVGEIRTPENGAPGPIAEVPFP